MASRQALLVFFWLFGAAGAHSLHIAMGIHSAVVSIVCIVCPWSSDHLRLFHTEYSLLCTHRIQHNKSQSPQR